MLRSILKSKILDVVKCIYCKEEKSRSHKTCYGRLMNRLIGISNTQNDTQLYTAKRASALSVKILIYMFTYMIQNNDDVCVKLHVLCIVTF